MRRLVFFMVTMFCLGLISKQSFYRCKKTREVEEVVVFSLKLQENVIAEPRFSWAELNKEFIFDGILYDISEIAYFDDKVVIKCHADIRETKIVSKLKIQKNQNNLHFQSKVGSSVAILWSSDLQDFSPLFSARASVFIKTVDRVVSMKIGTGDPPPEQLA